MKVFITGVNGQLGHDTANVLLKRGHQVVCSGSSPSYSGIQDGTPVCDAPYVQVDITDRGSVMENIAAILPEAVIHCAAWTAVDAAEDPDNHDRVRTVNVGGTVNIADACRDAGAVMVYISTDYVFSSDGEEPRKADCTDYSPACVYGRSKADGELVVMERISKYFIIRTAWAFGTNGNNFIKAIINASRKRDVLDIVDDQIGTPTFTEDLAVLIADMIETDRYGIYNVTNSEEEPGAYISWADLAEEVLADIGSITTVNRVTTEEYGLNKAERPRNSRLDKSKLGENGFTALPTWKDAVRRYILELGMKKAGD